MLGFPIEDAIRFLISVFPTEHLKKPSLFHSIRVGSYLFLNGYAEEICIAGVLHDVLEDTSVTEEKLKEIYGEWIVGAVKANSKNGSISKENALQDIVERCIKHSEGAVIVKSADVLDNFSYYTRCKEEGLEVDGEILRCQKIARLILEKLPKGYGDKIFVTLAEML